MLNVNNVSNGNIYLLGLLKHEFILSVIVILLLVIFEWYHKKNNLQRLLAKQALPIRWVFYLVIFFAILIFGVYGSNQVSEFIYFQF